MQAGSSVKETEARGLQVPAQSDLQSEFKTSLGSKTLCQTKKVNINWAGDVACLVECLPNVNEMETQS